MLHIVRIIASTYQWNSDRTESWRYPYVLFQFT